MPVALLALAGVAILAAMGLRGGKRRGARQAADFGNVFETMSDSTAFRALGLQVRAAQECPDVAIQQFEVAAMAFQLSAIADENAALIAYSEQLAELCGGLTPQPEDEQIGRDFYEAIEKIV